MTKGNKDLYKILGIKKDSTEAEIKTAYRKLALKWHPDKHKGDKDAETKFKEINVSYEILSDKQKRQQYDTFGAGGPGGGGGFQGGGFPGGGGAGGFDFSGFQNGASGFADIFETFFGGGNVRSRSKRRGPIRGNDVEAAIKIDFNEAVFGCEKDLEITKPDVCEHCSGKGAEPGSSIVTCKTCGGEGEIREARNTILGQMTTSRVCDACLGEGRVPDKKCTKCHGTTRARVKERVKVKIPAGVDNGSTIRLSGKGEGGMNSGPSGDLYINLIVNPSKNFVRSGNDIHVEIEIHLVVAVMGGEVAVDTIDGKEKIKIPAGTEDGKVFKIPGKGVPKVSGSGRGDHLVKIRIIIPKKLSKKEKELYLQLAEEAGIDTKKGGLFW